VTRSTIESPLAHLSEAQIEAIGKEFDAIHDEVFNSLGDRDALRQALRANIDHGGPVTGIQMREAAARHQPPM